MVLLLVGRVRVVQVFNHGTERRRWVKHSGPWNGLGLREGKHRQQSGAQPPDGAGANAVQGCARLERLPPVPPRLGGYGSENTTDAVGGY